MHVQYDMHVYVYTCSVIWILVGGVTIIICKIYALEIFLYNSSIH